MPDSEDDEERARVIEAYKDINFPGAYGGLNRFYSQYKKKYPDSTINRSKLQEIIETLPFYQLHVTKKAKFKRRGYKLPPGSLSRYNICYSCHTMDNNRHM